jgi:hypothetical protein
MVPDLQTQENLYHGPAHPQGKHAVYKTISINLLIIKVMQNCVKKKIFCHVVISKEDPSSY